MISYIWPIALVVLSNTLYQVCAKSVPDGMNPLASLTVTYLIGAVVSCAMYYILNRDANLQISMAQIVSSVTLAIILIFVGYLLYHEVITWNKVAGIIVCLIGLVLINYR